MEVNFTSHPKNPTRASLSSMSKEECTVIKPSHTKKGHGFLHICTIRVSILIISGLAWLVGAQKKQQKFCIYMTRGIPTVEKKTPTSREQTLTTLRWPQTSKSSHLSAGGRNHGVKPYQPFSEAFFLQSVGDIFKKKHPRKRVLLFITLAPGRKKSMDDYGRSICKWRERERELDWGLTGSHPKSSAPEDQWEENHQSFETAKEIFSHMCQHVLTVKLLCYSFQFTLKPTPDFFW